MSFDLQLRVSENMLTIKVVDSDYNIYKTGITKQHHFVQQFLNENLVALKEFLEQSSAGGKSIRKTRRNKK